MNSSSRNIRAKKSLGQNFLKDHHILQKILTSSDISPDDHIVEIGPGFGILTLELAKLAKKITAIELDQRLLGHLRKILPKNVELLHLDALKFQPPKTPYKVVANIPYYITSPLLNHFLQAPNKPASMTLLVQYEVARKICRLDPDMSVLSLQVALYGHAKLIKKVSPGAFSPQPKVDSAILHIEIDPQTDDKTAEKILHLAKQAFSQGRKKLSNTIPEYKEKLAALQIQDKRPQHLSITDWLNLLS
ncbi:ribosomal RNA small subunit methyltransferase A [Candidatus Peregrinibacteria bacterium]|nr:ribosomal RNA small subunit methyltransferase A [Candidatus Peregrinibacteria bacterium]